MTGAIGLVTRFRAATAALAIGAAAGAAALLTPQPSVASGVQSSPVAVAPPAFRRLNEAQYLRAVEQVFGPGITVPGRFDPPRREEGLLAIGDAHVTVTPTGIEQFELRARRIAAQVFAEKRAKLPCEPGAGFDAACARAFFARHGRLLYRRPLSDAELASLSGLAERVAGQGGGLAKGLEVGLSRLLLSPHFIFRVERSVADPAAPGGSRLDDWSLASRISFLLWNAPPDEALLDAVGRGAMADPAARRREVDRLIASPRFEEGVRAFFFDMFGYEQFAGLAKDQKIYPKFTTELARDAQEQTLRTLVDLLVRSGADYREIFSTRRTFMNRNLAAVYKVPLPASGFEDWVPYTFPEDTPRAGIMSLIGFLMLDPTHEGKSSPTIRGKTVRELLLCQPVPPPPPNVNFSIVQDDSNPLLMTARQRLIAHQENPACAGCHAITDPIGLSMENYDGIGAWRTHEKSALIDASGSFDGKPYVGLLGLTRLLKESPDPASCLVQRSFEYATGRAAGAGDATWLEGTIATFGAQGHRLPDLMRMIAASDAIAVAGLPDNPGTLAHLYRPERSAR